MKLSEIKPNPNNPRIIKDDKFKKLCDSIKEFPKMMSLRPIIVDSEGIILGGNMRHKALKELGYKEIPDEWVKKADQLTEDEKKRFIIGDNVGFGEWDWEALADWDQEDLQAWGLDIDLFDNNEETRRAEAHVKLKDRFIIPPFSLLDTTQKSWMDRKATWKDLGIKSELGRESGLTFAKTVQSPHYYEVKNALKANGKPHETDDVFNECLRLGIKLYGDENGSTSIFDPVLCEIMYQWFTPENGNILDPFAGGSVRGIVAAKLGFKYKGNDLSAKQIESNRINVKQCLPGIEQEPEYTTGDSLNIDTLFPDYKADLIFSCPPYADLEVYSNDKSDLSNMEYQEFVNTYKKIIAKSCLMLNDNRFAIFTVGDVRDKKGLYRNFISDTITAFEEAGLKLYNEFILINCIGSAAIRAARQFNGGRKNVKRHQNVLVFYKDKPEKTAKKIITHHEKVLVFLKGEPKEINSNFKELNFSEADMGIVYQDAE